MSQSSLESTRFYEAERKSIKLEHSDFAAEQEFDYLQETDDLNAFLLEKNWDRFFKKPGPFAQRRCATSIANKIFDSCMSKFQFRMDTVQMYDIITRFYDIDSTWYYNVLVQSHREQLQKDLESRIGKLKNNKTTKIGEDKVRLTFAALFLTK